ncbi:MAG TPA: SpoIID/LytB domain-containing protein [Gemmatimonadales bacterium]|nr:SpoIID/LytB domain-containing protein [Gemmatimonadales bacterium]
MTCTPPETPTVGPVPLPEPGSARGGPEIRIGLAVGAGRVEIAGDSGLQIVDADSTPAGDVSPGTVWTLRPAGAGLTATSPSGWRLGDQVALSFLPRSPAGLVLVNGRPYRGRVAVVRDRSGLTVVNVLDLESYLLGVVAAEMGRRDPSEVEALAAQAVISRTFAIRNLGKRATEGFDLYGTVVDQVYGGVTVENDLTTGAVQRTAGQILTWQGAPIDAFFFSTCGGRTADGTEVFAAAERPYLKSIRDVDGAGQPWCRISPRYQWREEWTADQLKTTLRRSLPGATGVSAEEAGTVSGVSVTGRTGSDRVASVTIQLRHGPVEVRGPAVRQVLNPVGESMLRSAVFRLTEYREGSRLLRLVAEGSGAGHGVGFCQWGAVGRARGGQDAYTILSAYFPGTSISRAY